MKLFSKLKTFCKRLLNLFRKKETPPPLIKKHRVPVPVITPPEGSIAKEKLSVYTTLRIRK